MKIHFNLKGKKNYFHYLYIAIILLFSISSFAQSNLTVFAARNNIGAIKVGYNSNLQPNQKYVLLRSSNRGQLEVGVVEVVKIKQGNAGIRLIENRNSDHIQVGDFLGSIIDNTLDDLFGNDLFDTGNSNNYQSNRSNYNTQPRYNQQNTYNQPRDFNKILQLDKEISSLEGSRKTGILMVTLGLGLEVVGWLTYNPMDAIDWDTGEYNESNNTLSWVCIGSGCVLSIWGGYKWWSASNQLGHLKAKRYDISLNPVIFQNNKKSIGYGLCFNVDF